MNSRFTSDPTLCKNAEDLKLLLRSFGPFSGRYHISYPRRWEKDVTTHIANLCCDIEKKKAEVLISKAKIDRSLIVEEIKNPKGTKEWNYSQDWISNLQHLQKIKKIFQGALLHVDSEELNLATYTLEDLPFASSEDVSVPCQVSDLVRVSEFTLLQSPEIVFVDPYLDISDNNRRPIIEEMLKLASTGSCQSVVIIARAEKVNETRIERALHQIKAKLANHMDISYKLIKDKRTSYEMHARYLFSINGGIKVDRGFQVIKGRDTHVAPIGINVLNQLVTSYLENSSSLNTIHHFKS